MANCFINCEIIHAEAGSSAVGLSAYLSRSQRTDYHTDEPFSFQQKPGLVSRGIIVPDDAPAWAEDGEKLWNAAQSADTTIDRRTKETRYCKNAQIAKHYVIALPKEISHEMREKLLIDFTKFHFGNAGVAVEWAIHEPDEENNNHHAHVLVSTRYLSESGFGKKARELNPDFGNRRDKNGERFSAVTTGNSWPDKWADYQNLWFCENGIDLEVDAKKLVREPHKGKAAHIEDGEINDVADEAKIESCEVARAHPELVFQRLLEKSPTITKQQMRKAFEKEGIDYHEIEDLVDRALLSEGALELFDRKKGQSVGRFTHKNINDIERDIVSFVDKISKQPVQRTNEQAFEKYCDQLTLEAEQIRGARWCIEKRFAIMQGDPGTGKSHTMKMIRQYVENVLGEKVYGVAPSNAVAEDMRKDGFQYGNTIHALIADIERGRILLNTQSRVIVDEAAMADTEILSKLTWHCARSGAALNLIGDDKQIPSVARGGIYTELREEHDAATLTDIRRQNNDQMKAASKLMSSGDVRGALCIYQELGALKFSETTEAAEAELLADYRNLTDKRKDGEPLPFVIAGLNASVDRMNSKIQQERRDRGEISNKTKDAIVRRREVKLGENEYMGLEVSVGDRIQMQGNDKLRDIYKGTVGTIVELSGGYMTPLKVTVLFDNGRKVELPPEYDTWNLGYCGTIHKSQGKTKPAVMQLRDNASQGRELSLVGMTRHKDIWKLYVGRDVAKNIDVLAKQMSKVGLKRASIHWDAKPYTANTLTEAEEATLNAASDDRDIDEIEAEHEARYQSSQAIESKPGRPDSTLVIKRVQVPKEAPKPFQAAQVPKLPIGSIIKSAAIATGAGLERIGQAGINIIIESKNIISEAANQFRIGMMISKIKSGEIPVVRTENGPMIKSSSLSKDEKRLFQAYSIEINEAIEKKHNENEYWELAKNYVKNEKFLTQLIKAKIEQLDEAGFRWYYENRIKISAENKALVEYVKAIDANSAEVMCADNSDGNIKMENDILFIRKRYKPFAEKQAADKRRADYEAAIKHAVERKNAVAKYEAEMKVIERYKAYVALGTNTPTHTHIYNVVGRIRMDATLGTPLEKSDYDYVADVASRLRDMPDAEQECKIATNIVCAMAYVRTRDYKEQNNDGYYHTALIAEKAMVMVLAELKQNDKYVESIVLESDLGDLAMHRVEAALAREQRKHSIKHRGM